MPNNRWRLQVKESIKIFEWILKKEIKDYFEKAFSIMESNALIGKPSNVFKEEKPNEN